MATDFDLRVEPADSGFPARLLVQPELFGPVFKSQLVELVGSVADELTNAVAEALRTDADSIPQDRTGLPLGGSVDLRRDFKEDEIDDLEALVRECRAWLMGAPSDRRILDPKAFLPPPATASQDEMFDAYLDLLDTLKSVDSGEVELPDLESLFDTEAFTQIRRWQELFNFNFWDWWSLHCTRADIARASSAGEEVPVDELRLAALDRGNPEPSVTVDFVSRRSFAGETVTHEFTAIRVLEAA
ncbi:MAG: hypothetical protein R8J94_21745 [Acidimicrobiia bacterium]|nr:hypothetical protein [Acidimicrobiia bacterium]